MKHTLSNNTRIVMLVVALISLSATGLPGDEDDSSKTNLNSTAPTDAPNGIDGEHPPSVVPDVRNATPERLEVSPGNIQLSNARDRQSIVAQMIYSNGITIDVTDRIQTTLATKGLVRKVEHTFAPVADGETVLKVSLEGFHVDVPVKVANSGTTPPLSFTNDVMPVFSKSGCNAGSCHGAARGKGRIPIVALRFRPQRRLPSLDAGNARTPSQPGRTR